MGLALSTTPVCVGYTVRRFGILCGLLPLRVAEGRVDSGVPLRASGDGAGGPRESSWALGSDATPRCYPVL